VEELRGNLSELVKPKLTIHYYRQNDFNSRSATRSNLETSEDYQIAKMEFQSNFELLQEMKVRLFAATSDFRDQNDISSETKHSDEIQEVPTTK
jgi:hypothetical protein